MSSLFRKVLGITATLIAALMLAQPAHALIRSANTLHFCWDAAGGHVASGGSLVIWHCHNRGNQQIYLDWQGGEFTAQDGNRYREAVMRFTDGRHCVRAWDMKVQPMGGCEKITARNVGGNRYTIQGPRDAQGNVPNTCVMPKYETIHAPPLQPALKLVEGQPLMLRECEDLRAVGHYSQFWWVEQ